MIQLQVRSEAGQSRRLLLKYPQNENDQDQRSQADDDTRGVITDGILDITGIIEGDEGTLAPLHPALHIGTDIDDTSADLDLAPVQAQTHTSPEADRFRTQN